MADYKPTRVVLSPEEVKRLAAEGVAMGKELRERRRRRNAIPEPDPRDAEIAALRAEVERLRAENAELREQNIVCAFCCASL